VRVTFDRKIRVEPCFHSRLTTDMDAPRQIYTDRIVLELKFTGRYPNWFRELVERFGLMRATASKYCGGVGILGEYRFSPAYQDSWREKRGIEQKLVGTGGPNPA
jgi:VTC domain